MPVCLHYQGTGINTVVLLWSWDEYCCIFCQRLLCFCMTVSVLASAQDGIVGFKKAHTCSTPSLCSVCKVTLETVPVIVWLSTDRSRPSRVECWLLPFSSFLQAISAVVLWPAHVQKALQASKHLCPAKPQSRCDVCCACQSVCLFIPSDSGMARAVDL